MMEVMHSTPQYQNIHSLNWTAPKYLLVMQHADSAQSQQLAEHMLSKYPVEQLHLKSQQDEGFASLLNELESRLQQHTAGLHSIVCGDESFIWMVQQCLVRNGCLKEEMSLLLDQSLEQKPYKKVYCVHCGQVQKTAETELCQCTHCKVELLIRSHFSERLGAYMGVCANPHQPMGVLSA